MSKYLNVFVQEQFESGGEMKSNYTKVGVAFPHDKGDGFNLKITFLCNRRKASPRWGTSHRAYLISFMSEIRYGCI